MVIMAFLLRVHTADEEIEMTIFALDPHMRKNVYKGVSFPLPDAVVRFALEVGVHNIMKRTCCSPVLAHMDVLRSSVND